ncbi:hypothetical protein JCM19232_1592 [Vibrio ishigakensis]|uniref:Uncharacterized protein n=1 Tax=Vibrio ishigakensis TaxID=1481914 RepID=A0A0B8PGG2_9VIBR|nr:hypothetical protein JCM19232_1592 [Vibrio ishigakensis]
MKTLCDGLKVAAHGSVSPCGGVRLGFLMIDISLIIHLLRCFSLSHLNINTTQ